MRVLIVCLFVKPRRLYSPRMKHARSILFLQRRCARLKSLVKKYSFIYVRKKFCITWRHENMLPIKQKRMNSISCKFWIIFNTRNGNGFFARNGNVFWDTEFKFAIRKDHRIELVKYSCYIIVSFVCSQKYRKKFIFHTYLDFFPNNLAW